MLLKNEATVVSRLGLLLNVSILDGDLANYICESGYKPACSHPCERRFRLKAVIIGLDGPRPTETIKKRRHRLIVNNLNLNKC